MPKTKMKESDGIRGLVPSSNKASLDRTYSDYLKQIDPRYNQEAQLALAESADPKFKEFLNRILEYRYRNYSYVALAKQCAIGLAEFSAFWRKACTHRAIAVAQSRAPEIVDHMANDARTRTVACERCDGLGWVAAPPDLPVSTPGYRLLAGGNDPKWIRDCPMGCNNGKVNRPGDSHARDRILEISGLVKKGGAAVQIVQNFSGAQHSSAVTALDVISIEGEVIDVEPIEGLVS
jgi:hypothetical protein